MQASNPVLRIGIGTAKKRAMVRVSTLALPLFLLACGPGEQPVQSASAKPQLLRGGLSEVRFRCGSESLRARMRQGPVQVQVGSEQSAVLTPVHDPRAEAGQAYGDGKLTLYKVPKPDTWMLARSGSLPPTECKPEPRPN